MAEYQKIEYRIGKDGKMTETVLEGASGQQCLDLTRQIEGCLGELEDRELLPEYHQEPETLVEIQEQTQFLQQ
ncbi:DUF2997 domain-containing protein [Spirulina sp. 06S082]|uniref:DUF2997 domain-containing protein n=1 Tax=Spirulina sp. 06S082 TaxID=3110248 RepID=UPI002B1EA914|nr:DUF2997 domain-containing protein [Spirulina sp. 06S082]MEA5471730.1 DUF2997 domain-containing protein [Spirulina sp. 06S082]